MKLIEGYYWPDDVGEKYKASLKRVRSMKKAIEICKAKNRLHTVVQAGGSMGVWPRELAKHFKIVYTFEPEPISFACLSKNVTALNVQMYPMALGAYEALVYVKRKSLTSHRIIEEKVNPNDPKRVSMIIIDSLELNCCDAILLDVEGYEFQALTGAINTINAYKPLILVEAPPIIDEQFEQHSKAARASRLLLSLKYRKIGHFEKDDIYEYRDN